MRISEGKPYPLGATADATGVNFAVFSAHATRVDVCIFDAPDGRELERFELPEYTDEVFHGHIAEVGPAMLYGFRVHINDTGTGNTLNLSHPRVIQMVADSLRYWVSEMRVDGFRFDLGTILAREQEGFKTESGFLKAIGQDPLLAEVKRIAEPWDCGPGGYQVGGFPPGWAEWNDTFRDTSRDFWRGMASAKALAPRLCASPDKFNFRGRKPWASVNFIVAHDGFTLRDLVSYNDKHNEANGADNCDGHSDNHSWNCGAEGPTDDPAPCAYDRCAICSQP